MKTRYVIIVAALFLLAGGVVAWKTHKPAMAADEVVLIKAPTAKAKKAEILAEAKPEPKTDGGMLKGIVSGHTFSAGYAERTPEELAIIETIKKNRK